MITVTIKATGEVREVTRNIAHDLIDRGIAQLYVAKPFTPVTPKVEPPKVEPPKVVEETKVEEPKVQEPVGYFHRQMRPQAQSPSKQKAVR